MINELLFFLMIERYRYDAMSYCLRQFTGTKDECVNDFYSFYIFSCPWGEITVVSIMIAEYSSVRRKYHNVNFLVEPTFGD
jgi:hypothetical protein